MEKKLILFFLTLGSISFGLSLPTLEKEVVFAFGSQGLAIQRLLEFISSALICWAYINNAFRKIIKKSLLIAYIPMITITMVTVIVCWGSFNPIIFLVGHIVSCMILSTFIARSITGLRAWRFSGSRERELYDNSKNLWTSIGALGGFGISSFFEISTQTSLILYLIGSFNSLGWIVIFILHKKEYLDSPDF